MSADCQPRCLARTSRTQAAACIEISVNTKYKHNTLNHEEILLREQLVVLIAADLASDHIDFPLRNSFFDGFSQNGTIEVNPYHPRVIFGKSRF